MEVINLLEVLMVMGKRFIMSKDQSDFLNYFIHLFFNYLFNNSFVLIFIFLNIN